MALKNNNYRESEGYPIFRVNPPRPGHQAAKRHEDHKKVSENRYRIEAFMCNKLGKVRQGRKPFP